MIPTSDAPPSAANIDIYFHSTLMPKPSRTLRILEYATKTHIITCTKIKTNIKLCFEMHAAVEEWVINVFRHVYLTIQYYEVQLVKHFCFSWFLRELPQFPIRKCTSWGRSLKSTSFANALKINQIFELMES